MIGQHQVLIYADRNAGGWGSPLNANPYFTTDLAGWSTSAGWAWRSGGFAATNAPITQGNIQRAPGGAADRVMGLGSVTYRLRARVSTDVTCSASLTLSLSDSTGSQGSSIPGGGIEGRQLNPGSTTLEFVVTVADTVAPTLTYLKPDLDFKAMAGASFSPVVDSIEVNYMGAQPVDMSCQVDQVAIRHGRDDSTSAPEPPSCTLDLSLFPGLPLPDLVDVGAVIQVNTQTPETSSIRFFGRVTDVNLGWDDAGEETPERGLAQLVCVGLSADLARRVVGAAPFPQELDGARVARVLDLAGMTLSPLTSDPGTVQILPRDVDSQPALDVAQEAAESASGILWQTRSGQTRYADADHRRGMAVEMILDACDVLVTPTWQRNTEGLINQVSLGYGPTPEGGEQPRYLASSQPSLDAYGRYEYSLTTVLAALADAQAMAGLMLARNSQPVWILSALPLDIKNLDQQRTTALLGLEMHSLVQLTGLPSLGTAPTTVNLWVEGWSETLGWGQHEMELVVSGYCRTAPPPRWDDLNPAWTWDNAGATQLLANANTEAGLTDYRLVPSPTQTLASSELWANSPTHSLELRTTDAATHQARVQYAGTAGNGVPATPGAPYFFSLVVKPGAPQGANNARSCQPVLEWLNAAGVKISATVGLDFSLPTVAPVNCSVQGTAPADAVFVRPYAQWKGMHAGGETNYMDDWSLTTGVPLTWDAATCMGPPAGLGRWNDTPASTRWDSVGTTTWDKWE